MKEIQQPQHQRRRGIGRKVGLVVILMQMVSVFFAVAMCVTMFRSLTTGILEECCPTFSASRRAERRWILF